MIMSNLPTMLFLWLLVFCCYQSKSTALNQVAIVEDAKDLKACNLSSNITTLSLKELESHLSSDTKVYFCSLKPSVILNTSISIHDVHNVSFIGRNNFTFDCKGRTGIRFNNILGLKVRDLNLIHCSRNYTMDVHYRGSNSSQFSSGMNIENCTDISFTRVTISNSNGMGMSIFNTRGTITLNRCSFYSNGYLHGGNGLFIKLSKNFSSNESVNDSQYSITHSTFENNHAREDYTPSTPFGRGGAICIFIREQSSSNYITISDCDFYNNTASRWGGAFFASVHDSATRNAIVVKDSRFTHNQSPFGKGGGANVGYQCPDPGNLCLNNSFLFDSCTFEHNRAQIGGGTTFISTRVYNTTVDKTRYNTIEYHNCTWVNNSAHYGAAIALLPDVWSLFKLGSLPSPNFTDCTMNSNKVTENDIWNSTLKAPYMQQTMGAGTMYCMLYSVHFNGHTEMKNNSGSAILGSSCKLSFCKQSSANFQHNRGYYGGAMFLIGYSTIKTAIYSSLSFINNTATLSGGAIYCKSSDILEHAYSRSCFISRSDMSDINSVSFLFSGNKAGTGNNATGLGNSIYATSLLPCTREYNISGIQCSYSLFNRIANFTFTPNKTNQVSTDVTTFSLTSDPNATSQNLTMVSIIPGKYTTLPFIGHDDLNRARNDVYVVTVNKHANSSVASHHGYSYISNNSIILNGYPGDEATIKLSTLGLHKALLSFKVKLQPCPPGYVMLPEDDKYSRECVCSADTDQPYIGIESCNISEFRAKRRDGFWFGYDNRTESDISFISGYCPTGFCTLTRFKGDLLPPNADTKPLNDLICRPNREGVLCSKCKENISVYFHSQTFKCGKQDLCHLGWLFYILSDIVPVTIVFVIVLAYNISFTSGSMNGFIFYAQVISFFQTTAHSRISATERVKQALRVIVTVYKMFNLQFFDHDSLSFCLLRHANNLTIMRFQYVSFIYSFLLLVFILVMFRVCNIRRIKLVCRCRVHSIQNSMIHGLSAFLVLCFAQCANISLSLLSYGQIQGKRERAIRTVVFLYGGYDWFGHKHLWYVLPALIIAFFMILIPLVILLAYPNGHKCLHILKLRERKCTLAISKLIPIHKLKPFLDSFQGCFKDNCRYFSGLYFLYRVLILLNVSMNYTNYFYITLQVQLIVMLLLHAAFQPYRKRKHNIIDLFLFVNMLLINSISQYSFGNAHVPHPVRKYYGRNLPGIQGILILFPLAIVLIHFTYKIFRTLIVKLKCKGRDTPNADLLDYCQLAAERSEPTHTSISIDHPRKYNTFP